LFRRGVARRHGQRWHRWFEYGSDQLICPYHPSYLSRNPAAKRELGRSRHIHVFHLI
jgi:uracil-DNA glycosylase